MCLELGINTLYISYWMSAYGTFIKLLRTSVAGYIMSTGTEYRRYKFIHANITYSFILYLE